MSKIALDKSSELYVDEVSGRKFFLDEPDDLKTDEKVTFLLNLHGGGSHGIWQHLYFPAQDYKNEYRLVIATPTAKTKEPVRRWVADADDKWLQDIVKFVCDKFGTNCIKSFWLVGHSQGGMTSNRLLQSDFFSSRVDGWLSLSGGRIGPAEIPSSFFEGRDRPMPPLEPDGPAPGRAVMVDCDMSFIFSTGGLEIVKLPETSPWAEKYNAGPRVRMPDIVDTEKGQVTGATPGRGPSWGREARPGTAEVYVYPNARGDRIIADVIRLDKGHTEGYEPKVTEELLKMVVSAPGGKLMALAQTGQA